LQLVGIQLKEFIIIIIIIIIIINVVSSSSSSSSSAYHSGCSVFARSDTEILGSNPTGGMDICMRLLCVCVILCVDSGLATGWSAGQGALRTVYRITKTEKEAKAQQKGCRA
jgi:hypothetical protein